MARRRVGGLHALLIAALLPACLGSPGGGGGSSTTAFTVPLTSTTPTPAPTTTTSPAVTTSTADPTTTSPSITTTAPIVLDYEVTVPEGEGPFPAVVLVHGGGWVAGDPSQMRDLALYLTDEGFLVLNTRYKLATDTPGFPEAVDDVACAVRTAASHESSDGTVAIIGHSAGAHISAIVALTGDRYGDGCPEQGSGVPDRLVGLAGPYDIDRLGLLMIPFFGGGPQLLPEAWLAGNPQRLTDENPALGSLIMYGDMDGIVEPGFAFDFAEALEQSGSQVLVETVEGARHVDMRDPDVVGALIATWLER